ncbi:MAG: DUF4965 domain-containing protein [Chthonomonadaceae bacterium]|nr:DUF4965 domain-containing protein [Chthonomonadaceae bacterium]
MFATAAFLTMAAQQQFRPPAIPLVTHDPYFSIWSFGDKLTDDWTKHWTGKNHAMVGMIRVDGKCYRWMSRGLEDVPAAEQVSLKVLPRRSAVTFTAGGVEFTVSFICRQDIRDENMLSRSDTYVSMSYLSADSRDHDVQFYLDCSSELVVNDSSQEVEWSRLNTSGEDGTILAMWHSGGRPLNRVGDDHRIDWGKLYMIPGRGRTSFGSSQEVRQMFVENGNLPPDDTRMPRPVQDDWPVAAWRSEKLKATSKVDGVGCILAYDDDTPIEYFRRPLRPVWRTESGSWTEDWQTANKAMKGTDDRFLLTDDNEWPMPQWRKLGSDYATLATLAYRQCLAGHKIVRDIDGTLLMFGKENFSNGCIGTVDVMYPACPIFLAYNPALLKANMEPIMQYASMPRWKWKFAPHDLGTYPKANGQVYGGGEKTEENQMPVEESGNMLIMAAAYLEKSGDKAWIEKYWSKFTEWAEYLKQYGVDPGNQLCTDDFAGHLAHNANLSIKAIVAMACYGKMCGALGHEKDKTYWTDMSHKFARDWMKMAGDGDHYRLAFDKPGTWSQKYNLVWDKVLKLGLFPQEVYDKEVAYYLKKMNKYGLPLDNRADYTKLDWTVWTACLASKKEDFEKIMAPVYKWMNETPDRVPLSDWYDTKTARCVGFRARTVVGGVFMPLLSGFTSPVQGAGG